MDDLTPDASAPSLMDKVVKSPEPPHGRYEAPQPNPNPFDNHGPAPIMRYFEFGHLPPNLMQVSYEVRQLATLMDKTLPAGPEKTEGLRKLLEAKDCFVRAALDLRK